MPVYKPAINEQQATMQTVQSSTKVVVPDSSLEISDAQLIWSSIT
jgi:hypothetical protein